jgi:glycosyltransferase involved in cell wall biosynthesis/peptidoglycan/xylan/chitin deacetylase (PgdA/CDA1 family)
MVSLLDALSERDDCSAEVIYFGQAAPERRWGAPLGQLPYRFLRGVTFATGGLQINPGLIHRLQKMRVDVWLINTCYDSPSTLIAAWWLGKGSTPWVYMNEPPRPRNWLLSALKSLPLQFVLKRAWRAIGMGERAAAMYRILLNDNRPTTSIPYCINLEDFSHLPISGPPEDGQPLHFLTCCQMIHRKGLDVLLKACEKLKDMNWRLTLVGDGPLRPRLEREFSGLFSKEQVRFVGEVPYEKRHEVFARQHIFVFPSRWDGWGMVVPEALAAGLPVVATDQVISAHEFVRNGVNGFIVPANDPSALADKMSYFISYPERISEMALAARQSLENYRSEIGAERLVEFLGDLLENKGSQQENGVSKNVENPLTWRALTTSESLLDNIGKSIRRRAKDIAIRTGIAVRLYAKPKGHRILVYHLVLEEDRKSFEEQIKFIKDHFVVCSLSKIIEAACREDGDKAYYAAITFDDGFRVLMRDGLEILEKYNIKACFFVPTGFVELSDKPDVAAHFSLRAHYYNLSLEPIHPEDLQALVKLGHEVGSHGVSHINLSAMSMKQAMRELDLSRQRIAEWTGAPPAYFAYPYGHTTSVLGDPTQWIRQAGYSYGFTLKRGAVNASSDPFLMPRDHIEGNWPIRDLKYFLTK